MTILDKIVAVKRTEVDRLPEDPVTVDSLRQGIAEHGPRRDFLAALANPRAGDVGLIAEVKKASPSKGVIREDFDPVTSPRNTKPLARAASLSLRIPSSFRVHWNT